MKGLCVENIYQISKWKVCMGKIWQISKWKVCVWENLTLYWQSDRWLIGLLPTPASFAEETENETKRYWAKKILRKNIEQKNTENKYWAKKYWEKILSKKYREKYIEKPTNNWSSYRYYLFRNPTSKDYPCSTPPRICQGYMPGMMLAPPCSILLLCWRKTLFDDEKIYRAL